MNKKDDPFYQNDDKFTKDSWDSLLLKYRSSVEHILGNTIAYLYIEYNVYCQCFTTLGFQVFWKYSTAENR